VLLSYIIDKNYASNIEELENAVAKHSFSQKESGIASKTAESLSAKQKLDGFKNEHVTIYCLPPNYFWIQT
jgi:hypothetical protein